MRSASNLPRETLAKVLNPAPGNHSGKYLTRIEFKLTARDSSEDYARAGIMSTRNAPGTAVLLMMSIASPAVRRSLSSLLVMSIPYVISMTRDPSRLQDDVRMKARTRRSVGGLTIRCDEGNGREIRQDAGGSDGRVYVGSRQTLSPPSGSRTCEEVDGSFSIDSRNS